MAEKRSPLDAMSPTQTFFGGIFIGFLVLCAIGFFILLSLYLGNDKAGNANEAAALPTAPSLVAPAPTADAISLAPVTDDDHILGNVDAPITIVEYSDFECPFCSRFLPTINQILADYPNDVRVVYRHFPLSFHPEAGPSAEAAECAAEQGAFWEYHDELFANQENLGDTLYSQLAQQLGLNTSAFADCLKSGRTATLVSEDQASGLAAGVGGTPHSIVVGPDGSMTPISGALPYAQVKPVIDSMLN